METGIGIESQVTWAKALRWWEDAASWNFASPLNQLQQRTLLMHWSRFIFFNHDYGRNGIIDLFFSERYLNAIQTNAHHLLRYLPTAAIVNKRRGNMLKELIKVIQQERYTYSDPVTEFLEFYRIKKERKLSVDFFLNF